jgi:hypothetical protein
MTILPIYRDFEDGATITALGFDIVLRRRGIGSLELPTGRLVACDPVEHPEAEPLVHTLPPGTNPVHLTVAELRDITRLAYASIHLSPTPATTWKLALAVGEDSPTRAGDSAGYQVLSGVGCFMDATVAQALVNYGELLREDDEDLFKRELRAQLRRQRGLGCGYAKVGRSLFGHDLFAFETSAGHCSSYLGFDEGGALTRVVTDFEVLELAFPSFSFSDASDRFEP